MNRLELLTPPVIRAGAVAGMKTLSADFAKSRDHVLRDVRDEDADPSGSAGYIPLQQYADSLERGAKQARNQNFALVFGNRFDLRNLGPLGYALKYVPTLRDGLTLFCENFDAVQDQTFLKLETSDNEARLIYSVNGDDFDVKDHDAEASIGILNGICRRSIGADWSASKMTFRHRRKQDSGLVQALFGFRPEYGADANKLCFDRRFLDIPVGSHDPYLLRLLKQEIEEASRQRRQAQGIIGSVKLAVGAQIRRNGEFSFSTIAVDLGIGERTLRDKLKAAGESYRNIVASERVERAKWLLAEGDLSLTQIALEIGFSEASALSRAFRSFSGISPQEYRKRETSLH